jgi:hypothetical protein
MCTDLPKAVTKITVFVSIILLLVGISVVTVSFVIIC